MAKRLDLEGLLAPSLALDSVPAGGQIPLVDPPSLGGSLDQTSRAGGSISPADSCGVPIGCGHARKQDRLPRRTDKESISFSFVLNVIITKEFTTEYHLLANY